MKPKYFGQFFNSPTSEALGSDGVFILDGRNKLEAIIQDMRDRDFRLRHVQHYTHFQIRHGTFTQYRNITSVIPIIRVPVV